MRGRFQIPTLALTLALVACAPTTRWDKPQTGADTMAADLEDCRTQAAREAMREVSALPPGYPFFGAPSYGYWRYEYERRLQQERFFAQNRLTAFCMRNKGYERVPIEQPNP